MAKLEIPFVSGLDESGNPKQMPTGALVQAENVRYGRAFQLEKSPGFIVHSEAIDAGGSIGTRDTIKARGEERLCFSDGTVYSYLPESGVAEDQADWTDRGYYSQAGAVQRRVVDAGHNRNLIACTSECNTTYGAAMVVHGYLVETATGYDLWFRAYEEDGTFLWEQQAAASNVEHPVLVLPDGANLMMCVYHDTNTNQIKCLRLDTSDLANRFASVAGALTAVAGETWLDAVKCSTSGRWHLVFHGVANNIRWYLFDTGFTIVGGPSDYACTGCTGEVSIARTEDASNNLRLWISYNDGTNQYIRVLNETTGAQIHGPHTIAGAGDHLSIGPAHDGSDLNGCWVLSHAASGGNVQVRQIELWRDTGATLSQYASVAAPGPATFEFTAASRVFEWGGHTYFWAHRVAAVSRDLMLLKFEQPATSGVGNSRIELAARAAIGRAENAEPYQRCGVAQLSSTICESALNAVADDVLDASPLLNAEAFRVQSGALEDRMMSVEHDGVLFLTGGALAEYDGHVCHKSGFLYYPTILGATGAGSGSWSGSYQYVETFEWTDNQGRVHRSAPSDPYSVTLSSHASVTITHTQLPTPDKPGARMHLYRTTDNGTTFYRVTPETGIDPAASSYSDTMTDATLISQQILYTQGERGGLGGQLQNDNPPSCKFIAKGKNRLIVGGLEDPSEVQWSRLFWPGEPVAWCDRAAFKARVPGTVTGVAALGDAWIVFTTAAIYSIYGDGPDDMGQGTFDDPRAITTALGCKTHLSIVETSTGVVFQGADKQGYLLPIDGGPPQWITAPIRNTFTDDLGTEYEIKGSVLDEHSQCLFWYRTTLWSGHHLFQKRLVFDLRQRLWTIEDPHNQSVYYRGVAVWGDAQAWTDEETFYHETPEAFVFNSAQWAQQHGVSTVQLADIRPFGSGGRGRIRSLVLRCEGKAVNADDVAVTLTDEDESSSVTFEDNVGTGDFVEYSWRLRQQKRESLSLSIADASAGDPLANNAGVRFISLTLDVEQHKGLVRADRNRRA